MRVGCHQADATEQAARRVTGERPACPTASSGSYDPEHRGAIFSLHRSGYGCALMSPRPRQTDANDSYVRFGLTRNFVAWRSSSSD